MIVHAWFVLVCVCVRACVCVCACVRIEYNLTVGHLPFFNQYIGHSKWPLLSHFYPPVFCNFHCDIYQIINEFYYYVVSLSHRQSKALISINKLPPHVSLWGTIIPINFHKGQPNFILFGHSVLAIFSLNCTHAAYVCVCVACVCACMRVVCACVHVAYTVKLHYFILTIQSLDSDVVFLLQLQPLWPLATLYNVNSNI